MITFDRHTGKLFAENGTLISAGIWAGHGNAANDVTREREIGVGPLPAGIYSIGAARTSAKLGSFVLDLVPTHGTEMYGRSLFRIHGDTVNDVTHSASDGCIIAPKPVRVWINRQADRRIKVT